MSDLPIMGNAATLPLHIHTHDPLFCASAANMRMLVQLGAGTSAQTWVANVAGFFPVAIPFPYPVRRVFWFNGSTIASGNCDFGIYTSGGGRIYSTGSTAQAGASAYQYVTPTTPFLLDSGLYWFAFACDSTTSHVSGSVLAAQAHSTPLGIGGQATAFPLPSPATIGAAQTLVVPVCGITRTASGF